MKLGQAIGFFSFIAALYIFWQTRQIILLAFTAMVLAIALNRLVKQFQQHLQIKRFLAVLFTLVLFLAILVLVLGMIVSLVSMLLSEIMRLEVWF